MSRDDNTSTLETGGFITKVLELFVRDHSLEVRKRIPRGIIFPYLMKLVNESSLNNYVDTRKTKSIFFLWVKKIHQKNKT